MADNFVKTHFGLYAKYCGDDISIYRQLMFIFISPPCIGRSWRAPSGSSSSWMRDEVYN